MAYRQTRTSLSIIVSLLLVWVFLSGHFSLLLLGLGLFSAVLVTIISHKMDMIDHETPHTYHLYAGRMVLYWFWLSWEIIKANIIVVKILIDPKLPISPTVVRIKASQRTDLGLAIHANSITMTPGTISIDLTEDEITVHCLTRTLANDLERGAINSQVQRLETR